MGIKILQNRRMAEDLVLSMPQARRLAVRAQHQAGPEPPRASTANEDFRRYVYSGPAAFGVS